MFLLVAWLMGHKYVEIVQEKVARTFQLRSARVTKP